jgi:hypothetical protein
MLKRLEMYDMAETISLQLLYSRLKSVSWELHKVNSHFFLGG